MITQTKCLLLLVSDVYIVIKNILHDIIHLTTKWPALYKLYIRNPTEVKVYIQGTGHLVNRFLLLHVGTYILFHA